MTSVLKKALVNRSRRPARLNFETRTNKDSAIMALPTSSEEIETLI